MMTRALSTLAVALLLAAALFVPLVFLRPAADRLDAGSATPPPDATLMAEPTATPEPGDADCGSAIVSYDAAEPTIANRSEGSATVVLATVESVGEALWNTKTGAAPEFTDDTPASGDIYRPLSLSVATLVKGDVLGATHDLRLPGGTVGCYTFDYENTPDLKPGQQYAFFLGPSLTASGAQDVLSVNEAWPVSGGLVQTPLEGEVSVPMFVAAVEKAPIGPLNND